MLRAVESSCKFTKDKQDGLNSSFLYLTSFSSHTGLHLIFTTWKYFKYLLNKHPMSEILLTFYLY